MAHYVREMTPGNLYITMSLHSDPRDLAGPVICPTRPPSTFDPSSYETTCDPFFGHEQFN
jgi:hypothetical protein